MKTASNVLFLSLTIAGVSYPITGWGAASPYSNANKVVRKAQKPALSGEELFQANVAMLSKPIADFVNDFKTWPKEEQDKIETFKRLSFRIKGRPVASDKYDGNIGLYLDCRLDPYQMTPFLLTIDYLKQQKLTQ